MAEEEKQKVEDTKENSSSEEESGEMEKLKNFFSSKLKLSSEGKPEPVLDPMNIEGVVKFIQNEEKCKNIIVMCGAGVSTSAGIPDFRSPGSGLYDNLGEFNLSNPQAIFEINFFREEPRPFYSVAKKLLPSGFRPTPCHYFMRLLHEKGKLFRVYTQNIDTLERMSGIPEEKIVEAHGTFHTSHCINSSCRKEFSLQWMRDCLLREDVPKCPTCGSYIKPDVVFFGENLPARFFQLAPTDFPKCDLLIVLGTSLVVQPFASLVDRVGKDVPRLLINKEKVGQSDLVMSFLGLGAGLDYDSEDNHRDVAWLGLCDDGCQLLAQHLGWADELKELIAKESQKLDEKDKEKPKEWL